MYKKEKIRNEEQSKFKNIEEYLKSLDLELDIYINNLSFVERMAQMTQKTNQFNLTTKRYTDSEILNMIESNKFILFCFGVKDKFGDYGTTGLFIIENNSEGWNVDSFLLSCRILGRNIELAFVSFVIDYLKKINVSKLNASYIKTLKNAQVAELYDKLGFTSIDTKNEIEKKYLLNLNDFKFFKNTYIKINYEG
jgi:FkbH-like protein